MRDDCLYIVTARVKIQGINFIPNPEISDGDVVALVDAVKEGTWISRLVEEMLKLY